MPTARRCAASPQPGCRSPAGTRSSETLMPVPWILLQLSDSALPTGGFVHSAGLESAFQQGEVRSAADLRRFIRDALWLTGHSSLPLASAAHADPDALPALDARAAAFLSSEVANR